MKHIGVHLRHDSALCIREGETFRNIELERLFGIRHFDWHRDSGEFEELLRIVAPGVRDYEEGIIAGAWDPSAKDLLVRLGISRLQQVNHHLCHAAVAFYQSPFDQALIISYDGGGNDGRFQLFRGNWDQGVFYLKQRWNLNLGIPFRALAYPIREIQKPCDGRELSNAGKLMGLVAFGNERPEWTSALRTYFEQSSRFAPDRSRTYEWIAQERLSVLGKAIGLDLRRNSLDGSLAYDLAASAQGVFEELLFERVSPIIEKLNLPVCLTGGCALNVIANQKLLSKVAVPVFVPPNPNDGGLAMGALCARYPPNSRLHSVAYSGVELLDKDLLPSLVDRHDPKRATLKEVATLLAEGFILAVVRGPSEHGPRALGNRSILCDPGAPGMKDRLNLRVKFREPFRPYAPVMRAEDSATYLENARCDLSFMSFNPTVRHEWRPRLGAAVHVDGTARAQTVTRQQNEWLHRLLGAFQAIRGYGVLLNTSFNIRGRPIVARISDAFAAFESTDIDALLIDEWLFQKNKTLT